MAQTRSDGSLNADPAPIRLALALADAALFVAILLLSAAALTAFALAAPIAFVMAALSDRAPRRGWRAAQPA